MQMTQPNKLGTHTRIELLFQSHENLVRVFNLIFNLISEFFEIFQQVSLNNMLGPLCYKLITIVNCYLEADLTCFVYCPKALYLIIFIVWHPF